MATKTPEWRIRVAKEDGNTVEHAMKDDKSWAVLWDTVLEVKEKGGSMFYYPLVSLQGWEVTSR